jgi:hypothetical protein
MFDFLVASDFDLGLMESKKLDFFAAPATSSTESWWLRSLWGVVLRFRIEL